MKRFTETAKWNDPWFRKLTPAAKLLWEWITNCCDSAGVIEPDYELATFQIGLSVSVETVAEFAGRVEKLACGKLHILRFVEFQVGTPSKECKAHNPIFQSWKKHKIERVSIPLPDGIHTVQEKEKDKETEKVTDGRGAGEGGLSLDESVWVEKIQSAYPDRSCQRETMGFIVSSMQRGIPPETILEGTKVAADLIGKNYDGGIKNRYVAKALAFFRGEKWENPEIHFAPKETLGSNGGPKPESVWTIKQQLEAIDGQIEEINSRRNGPWSELGPKSKEKLATLNEKRKELRTKLSGLEERA